MKKTKNSISLLLKTLYILLFGLSFILIITFYVDKGQTMKVTFKEDLSRQAEVLSLLLNKEDINTISYSSSEEIIQEKSSSNAYQELQETLSDSKDIIGLEHSEIRLLQKIDENNIRTLASSDDIHKYGEVYRDRTGQFSLDLENTNVVSTLVNDDMNKLFIVTPIKDENNRSLGHLLITAPESPYMAKMNKSLVRNILITLAIYLLLGTFFMKSLRKNREGFASELTKTRNIKEQLEKNNKELKMLSLVAKTSKDLIVITDHKGVILWINDGYKKKNNYSQSELEHFIGKSLLNVSKNKQIGNIIKNANSFKEEFTYETKSLDHNANEFWAETIVKPVISDNELKQIIFIDQDITETMLLKEKLAFEEMKSKTTIKI